MPIKPNSIEQLIQNHIYIEEMHEPGIIQRGL